MRPTIGSEPLEKLDCPPRKNSAWGPTERAARSRRHGVVHHKMASRMGGGGAVGTDALKPPTVVATNGTPSAAAAALPGVRFTIGTWSKGFLNVTFTISPAAGRVPVPKK